MIIKNISLTIFAGILAFTSVALYAPSANAAVSYNVCSTKSARTAIGEYSFVNINNPNDVLVESAMVVYRSASNPHNYCATGVAYRKDRLSAYGVGFCNITMVCAAGYTLPISTRLYSFELTIDPNSEMRFAIPSFDIVNTHGTYRAISAVLD